MSERVEPFRVNVDDAVLDDLRERLGRTRFPDEIPGTGWEYGTPIDEVRGLVEYWRDGYDWRAAEANPHALPLLLVHGWPGSIVEFLDVIPRLTDEFHVVVPSLPGYGY